MQDSTSKARASMYLNKRIYDRDSRSHLSSHAVPTRKYPRVAGVEDVAVCPGCERLIAGTNNHCGFIPHYLLRGRYVAYHDMGTHKCALVCYRAVLITPWTVTGSHVMRRPCQP